MRKPAIILMCLMAAIASAQSTHIIEPAILEVHYNVSYGKYKDVYALRCGRTVSQYFSLDRLRFDSIISSRNPVLQNILLDEMLEAANHRDDPSKQRPSSPGHNDYLYWNLAPDSLSAYTRVFDGKYLVKESAPAMDWTIDSDSLLTILGYVCHKATTRFRGREWTVWFADDIPMSLGPWKLNGLPGLILQAVSHDFISITASSIASSHIAPVTFYNHNHYRFEPVERKKYLKMKNNPNSYPDGTIINPSMELE